MNFIAFPHIDPVIFTIYGPIALRWYNLAYMLGLMLGWAYCRQLIRLSPSTITLKNLDDLLVWSLIGIFIGGRLGHILFYEPSIFLANPLNILKTWEGGMSFHGGMMGLIVSFYIFHKKYKIPLPRLLDLAAAAAPIGLFFGRIANFINDELYGRPTDVPWAVLFPSGGYAPRHPSQLYEAFFEGAVLFGVLLYFILKKDALKKPGILSGLFLVIYGASRFFVEFFREPESWISIFTTGQALCIPMVAVGVYVIAYVKKHD
ncbi:MAG: prolipoprotein diacylglyceryl transferase [Alphaproteobacteria bacterium]